MRRIGLDLVRYVAVVEREAVAFALFDEQRVLESVRRFLTACRARFGPFVFEQQVVGDVLVAGRALLGHVRGPAEEFQDWPDQVLFGNCLVGVAVTSKTSRTPGDALTERCELFRNVYGCLPLGRRPNAVGQEVVGKKLALHVESRRGMPSCSLS